MGTGKTYSTKYLLDSNNSSGVAGQVLSTTSTGIDWVNANTVPGAGLWIESGIDIYNSNSGNVGIGTSSPNDGKLQVLGNSSTDWGAYVYNINANGIGMHVETNSYGTEQLLRLSSVTDAGGGNSVRMMVLANGNVGIGTQTPTARLMVKDSSDSGFDSGIAIIRSANTQTGYINMVGGAMNINSPSIPIALRQAGSVKAIILNNGNVGINTTTPGEKLVVDGVIESPYLEFKPFVFYDFNSDTTSQWGKGNATLSTPSKSVTRFTTTGTDANINKNFNGVGTNSPAIPGGQNQIIRIRYKWISGTAGGGEIFYATAGHNYDGGYYKSYTLNSDGDFHTLVLDMSNLTAGGTDWIDNDITAIRFDFINITPVVIDIDWISVGGNGWGTQYFENDVIFENGKVGIGTNSPTTLLQVGDTPTSGGSSFSAYGFDGAAQLFTTRAEGNFNTALYLYNNPVGEPGTGTGIMFRARSSTTDSQQQATVYSSWTTNTHASRTAKLVFQTANSGAMSDKMTILGNGNVGIGTTGPSFQLSIENHATTTSTATLEIDGKRTNGTNGAVGELIFSNNGDTFATVAGFRDGADNKGSLQFQTQGAIGFATRMTIATEGAVTLNQYTLTQQTADSVYLLGVDSSGKIVQSTNIPAGSGGTAGPYLPLAGGTMTGATLHGDTVLSRYGTDNDFSIYHNGTDGYLQNETGNLIMPVGNVLVGATSLSNLAGRFEVTSSGFATPTLILKDDTGTALSFTGQNNGDKYIQARDISSATYYNIILNPLGGNVGIGTTNPTTNLEIFDAATSVLTMSHDGGGGSGSRIDFNLINAGVSQPITAQIKATDDGAFRSDIIFTTKTAASGSSGLTERMRIDAGGNVGIQATTPFSRLQSGSQTFTGANGMFTNSRVGISNHGTLTGMMLASTYNDPTYPEYGLVFIQGPSTSSYNVWSISPDGPAKGSGLSFIYKTNTGNIHTGTPTVYMQGSTGNVGIGLPLGVNPLAKLHLMGAFAQQFFTQSTGGTTNKFGIASGTTWTQFTVGASVTSAARFYHDNSYIILGDNGANVGINNTSPNEKLDVTGNIFVSAKFGNLTAGSQGIQFEAPTTAMQTCRFDSDALRFFAGGSNTTRFTITESAGSTFVNTVTATNFILSSDERLKENIKTLEPKVISAEWKSFNAKDDDSYRTGVIAQELEIEHPEFVETNDKGFKSVKYIDLLISKIAELEHRIKQLEK